MKPGGPQRMLLFSDNRSNMELLRQFITAEGGPAVVAAATMEQARAHLDTKAAPAVDFALLDVARIDADVLALCDTLQARRIPFAALLLRPANDVRVQLLGRGARAVMEKPISKTALAQLLRFVRHDR